MELSIWTVVHYFYLRNLKKADCLAEMAWAYGEGVVSLSRYVDEMKPSTVVEEIWTMNHEPVDRRIGVLDARLWRFLGQSRMCQLVILRNSWRKQGLQSWMLKHFEQHSDEPKRPRWSNANFMKEIPAARANILESKLFTNA
jgi:hypothetical protein